MDSAPPALLSVAAVAKRLGVSVVALRRWVRHGTFPPPIRLGRLLRWRPEDVERFLDARAR